MLRIEKELMLEHLRMCNRCAVRVGGFCMAPVIRDGAIVTITATHPCNLVIGDIVAYFVGDNLFVHRLIERLDGLLRMKGDNANAMVHEVAEKEIIGRIELIENPSLLRRSLKKMGNFILSKGNGVI
jgi:hypothetical protein